MSLLCFSGKHAARTSGVWNQGLHFSSCRRCGCDMIRADKAWEAVPLGFRIVWRPAMRPGQSGRTEAIRNLPMVIPQDPLSPKPAAAPSAVRSRAVRRPFGWVPLIVLGVEILALCGANGFRKWLGNLAPKGLRRHRTVLLMAP
jgi:hypothetical protein